MSNQYPKMLYLGGLTSHAIANNEDEADALKERGYVEHDEAIKLEPKVTEQTSDDASDQLGEAYEHIERQEEAIALKDEEILKLKGELDKALQRLTDKEHEITVLKSRGYDTQEVAELKAKLAIYEETKDVNGDGVVSYDEMTNKELKALLDQRGVEYVARDGKDDLIQKLQDSE